ncbi:hypothetical protein AYK21_00370 [Thermoplasmatales archaeon SG8-52-2]|nr:MAG: hypothetical protein AYK21_00370 [Thermoplasmatales archaeon SG8-52-2]
MVLFNEVLKKHGSGITINLFVTPNSDKSKFPAGFNKWRNRIEINVCSKAKDNHANMEVIRVIADFFNKQVKDVYVLTGKKSREKTVLIEDISEKTVSRRLKELLNGL